MKTGIPLEHGYRQPYLFGYTPMKGHQMTKKDFKLIASVLGDHMPPSDMRGYDRWRETVYDFADRLADTNPASTGVLSCRRRARPPSSWERPSANWPT
jgi:hypothetical protein